MGGVETSDLRKSFQKAQVVCKAIRYLFIAATVIYAFTWIASVVGIVAASNETGQAWAAPLAYVVFHGLIVSTLLLTMVRIFAEASQGRAPFSEKQADRLRLIALLALLLFLLEAVFTAVVSYNLIPEVGYSIGINDAYPTDSINLNVGMLAFSAIMYSLSALFRYAALLQQLSDDTV